MQMAEQRFSQKNDEIGEKTVKYGFIVIWRAFWMTSA
jgi:hypothetical protein